MSPQERHMDFLGFLQLIKKYCLQGMHKFWTFTLRETIF